MSAVVCGMGGFPRDARLTHEQRAYVVTCISSAVRAVRQQLAAARRARKGAADPEADALEREWQGIASRVQREHLRLAHRQWGKPACSSAT